LTKNDNTDNISSMLKIRLQRVGRKHDPSFRVVLTDRRNATKSGKFLEVLGSYNARFGSPVIKADRVLHWIKMGAQPSDTVHNLLINEKVIEGKKINVLPKKSPIIKEIKEEEKTNTATVEEKKEEKADSVVEDDSKKEIKVEEKTDELPKEKDEKNSEEKVEEPNTASEPKETKKEEKDK